jgi:hypothetical protein
VSEQHLSGHHRETLRQIFGHPLARNLEWSKVTSLIDEIGTLTERHDG